jgi:hypothetical protein
MSRFEDIPFPTPEGEAFEAELAAAPWAYGQSRELTINEVLYRMRAQGLDVEADWVLREMTILAMKG